MDCTIKSNTRVLLLCYINKTYFAFFVFTKGKVSTIENKYYFVSTATNNSFHMYCIV